MRNVGIWMAVGIMVMSLSGCAGDGKNQNGSSQNGTGESQSNQSGEDGANRGDEDTQGNGSSADADGNGEDAIIGWSDEMETLRNAVEDALGENYWPDTRMDSQMLETVYGISSDMYEDYLAEMPTISANVDTLLVIKANDDTADEVETILTEYREDVINNSRQYPMNLGKVQASRIERLGDYVCFVQLGGDTMSVMDIGDEEVIRHCQEQNELAIAVLEKQLVP
ncbi:MAG: DUF4358 domain-containing protein [Roseburia sp.]|nr:DUF4358 domain-containing protein [Roseburia sp.]